MAAPLAALAAGWVILLVIVIVLVLFAAVVALMYLAVLRDNRRLAAKLPAGQWYAQLVGPGVGAKGGFGRLSLDGDSIAFVPDADGADGFRADVEDTTADFVFTPLGPGVRLTSPEGRHALRLSREPLLGLAYRPALGRERPVGYVGEFLRAVENRRRLPEDAG